MTVFNQGRHLGSVYALDPNGVTEVVTQDGLVIPMRPTRAAADGGDGDLQVEARGWWIAKLNRQFGVVSMRAEIFTGVANGWEPGGKFEDGLVLAPCEECMATGDVGFWLPKEVAEAGGTVCVVCRGRGFIPAGIRGQDFQ